MHGCFALSESTIISFVKHTPHIRKAVFSYVKNCGSQAMEAVGRFDMNRLSAWVIVLLLHHESPSLFFRSWPMIEFLDLTSCDAIGDTAIEAFVHEALQHTKPGLNFGFLIPTQLH